MKQNKFPPGWDEKSVQRVIEYYENQTEDEAVAEDENRLHDESVTWREIPNDAKSYCKRGISYYNKRQYDKAITDYNEAIKLKPDYAEAYSNRAKAYVNIVDFDKAIEDYTKVIELNPKAVDAYYSRGKLYVEGNEYEKAIADYSMAINLILSMQMRPVIALHFTMNKGSMTKQLRDLARKLNSDRMMPRPIMNVEKYM
ncbi:MAG: tetratricopeptide repeat protein [Candidatus Poribacteria bacterium]|nr:tetratricopeptide repeat protein [Candidatus Poribacteria bacterium]